MEDTLVEAARPAAASAISRLRNRNKVAGTYSVALDREWVEEIRKVKEELDRARSGILSTAKSDLKALEARLAALEERRGEAVLEFKFRHCSPVRYDTLIAGHRPDEEQLKKDPKAMWQPSFRPAFVEEVLIEPELTHDEILELFGEDKAGSSLLSPAEAASLFSAALIASNSAPRIEDL